MPALLTSTSSPPSACSASSKKRATSARSGDVATGARQVADRSSPSASSAADRRRVTCTRAPSPDERARDLEPDPARAGGDQHAQRCDLQVHGSSGPSVLAALASTVTRSTGRIPEELGQLYSVCASIAVSTDRNKRTRKAETSREEPRHDRCIGLDRRTLLKGAGGLAALAGIGAPAIVTAQADAIRIGHLTPRTGFLGPLGEYAVMGVQLAADEINAGGRRHGPQDRAADGGLASTRRPPRQGRALDRARQGRGDHRRDLLRLRARDRAGRAAQPRRCSSTPAATRTRCAARLQSVHVPHRGREHDVREGRRAGAAARRHGQGQEVVLPHRRLRVRPRPAEGREALHGGERRPVRGRRAGADRRHRLLGLPAQDPQGASPTSSCRTSPARRSPTS